ncbi:hypothetical protein ACJQWK_06378 [Exserohilum turcicum]
MARRVLRRIRRLVAAAKSSNKRRTFTASARWRLDRPRTGRPVCGTDHCWKTVVNDCQGRSEKAATACPPAGFILHACLT